LVYELSAKARGVDARSCDITLLYTTLTAPVVHLSVHLINTTIPTAQLAL